MKEKDFQSAFNHWLKEIHRQTGAFELKLTRTDSLPFSAVAPHQIAALQAVKNGTLVFKIPDAGYQNPFDCFCLAGVPAFIVIKYPSGSFYLIDIDIFVEESQNSARKSLTEMRARELSTVLLA